LLRELLQVEVPPFDEARLTEATLTQLVPVEYHADAVVLFDIIYDRNQPVFGTIFEVQLERKDRKRYTSRMRAARTLPTVTVRRSDAHPRAAVYSNWRLLPRNGMTRV
jgi:hypothetical protein